MNVVSFGGGTNSTAMIVGMYLHKIPVDLILFADPGAEQPHTYEYIEVFDEWLVKHGLPKITAVNCVDKDGNRLKSTRSARKKNSATTTQLAGQNGPRGGGYINSSGTTQAKRDASNTRPRRMKQIKSTKIIIRFTNGAGTGLNVSA